MQHWPGNQEDRDAVRTLAAGAAESQSETAAATHRRPAPDPFVRSQKIARKHTAEAFAALVEVMKDTAAAATARVNAANTILEWGHGKRGETATETNPVETIVAMKLKGE